MTDDQRALLDECTNRPTCTAAVHLSDCPSSPDLRLLGALQRSVDAARQQRREQTGGPASGYRVAVGTDGDIEITAATICPCSTPGETHDVALHEPSGEHQTWERRLAGTSVAEQLLHLVVDDQGRAYVHEALLAQLLVDAGWERTS